MADDPFPRDRLATTARHLPAYLRLAWSLAMDPALAKRRRAAVIAAAGYLVSPIDLLPDMIPVLGQLDDLAVALAALRFAMAGLDPERRQRHLAEVGLVDGDLTADLATVAVTMAWILRSGARATLRVATRGGSLAVTGAHAAGAAAAAGASRAEPAVRSATAPLVHGAANRTPAAARQAASKVAPAARSAAARAAPAAREAAGRASSAAKGAAALGAALGRRTTARTTVVRVSVPRLPALPAPSASAPGDDRLDVEPDVLDGRDG